MNEHKPYGKFLFLPLYVYAYKYFLTTQENYEVMKNRDYVFHHPQISRIKINFIKLVH